MNGIALPKKVKRLFKDIWYDAGLYVMLLPGFLYFFIFKYLPMYGILISFQNYNIVTGFSKANWVGMDIYKYLFTSSSFNTALMNNIRISLIKIFFGFPLPIILSLIINEVLSRPYRRMIQSIVIIPSFISWFVLYGILVAMCNLDDGIIPGLLRGINSTFGTNIKIVNYMSNKATADAYLQITYVWKGTGMGTVVYLAAIMGIDQQLYEAAMIDGAGRMRQLWHITLSSMRSTIIVLLIFRVGDIMNAGFDQVFALSNSLIISEVDIIDTYVYRVGMVEAKFSVATAAGLFKSMIGLVLVLATNAVARKVDPASAIM